MQAFFDHDADLNLIRWKRVAVLGYGNQGRPQALNLRDSGVAEVAVAVRAGSSSEEAARKDGLTTLAVGEAAEWGDVIVLLIPDEEQARLYREELEPRLRPGTALIFAHGLAIHFGLIQPRSDLDVILVAPKGPGTALRQLYVDGNGMIALLAVAQDASGSAQATGLAYAAALGCGRAGILPTSFAEECEADLFNEQAVIWGAVPEIILAGYETLVDAGFSEEVAYFECLTEVKLLADLLHTRGIAGMRQAISTTAEFGALQGGTRIVTADTRTEMRRILRDVRSGKFTEDLVRDAEAGYPRLEAARSQSAAHPIEDVGRRLRGLKP